MSQKKTLMVSGAFVAVVGSGLFLKYMLDYNLKEMEKPQTEITVREAHEMFDGDDVALSNGMRIPKNKILSREIYGNIKKYMVDVKHLPEKTLLVVDEGDGRPYLLSGKTKDFDIVYKYKGMDFPVWDPAAFEGQPMKKEK